MCGEERIERLARRAGRINIARWRVRLNAGEERLARVVERRGDSACVQAKEIALKLKLWVRLKIRGRGHSLRMALIEIKAMQNLARRK